MFQPRHVFPDRFRVSTKKSTYRLDKTFIQINFRWTSYFFDSCRQDFSLLFSIMLYIYEKDIYYGFNLHSPFSPCSLTWRSLCLFLVCIYCQLKYFSCSQMFLRRLFSRCYLCPLPTAMWFYETYLQTVIPFICNNLIICHRNQSQKKNFFFSLSQFSAQHLNPVYLLSSLEWFPSSFCYCSLQIIIMVYVRCQRTYRKDPTSWIFANFKLFLIFPVILRVLFTLLQYRYCSNFEITHKIILLSLFNKNINTNLLFEWHLLFRLSMILEI